MAATLPVSYCGDELLMAPELFGVSGYFSLAEGNTGAPGGFKADHLASHLERLEDDHRSAAGKGVQLPSVISRASVCVT